jgi:hypothetical protein
MRVFQIEVEKLELLSFGRVIGYCEPVVDLENSYTFLDASDFFVCRDEIGSLRLCMLFVVPRLPRRLP